MDALLLWQSRLYREGVVAECAIATVFASSLHVVAAGTKRKRQEEHLSRKRAAVATQDAIATELPASHQAPVQAANGVPSTAVAALTAIQLTAAAIQPSQQAALLQANSTQTVTGGKDTLAHSAVSTASPVQSPTGPLHIGGDTDGIGGRHSHQSDAVTAELQTAAVHKSPRVNHVSKPAALAASQQNGAQAGDANCALTRANTHLSSGQCVVAKPLNDARGHTGYLTFARRSVDA